MKKKPISEFSGLLGFKTMVRSYLRREREQGTKASSRDATSISDFSFGLDFVQPDGECKHVELSGTESDRVNP
jgi:hypothetical protein